MSGETERGIKWWIRYVGVPILVPLLGGGGIIAIILALTPRTPPLNNTRSASDESFVGTASPNSLSDQGYSTPSPRPSREAAHVGRQPTGNSDSRGVADQKEAQFKRLLGEAEQLLTVGHEGRACVKFQQAAETVPDRYRNQVKWGLVSEARSFSGSDSHRCANLFAQAFQVISAR
jgi:hypothetical protein